MELSKPLQGRFLPYSFKNRAHRCRLLSMPLTSCARDLAGKVQIGEQYFNKDRRPIILFDGVCNLCNGGVNTALKFDKKGSIRFAALQSEAGKTLLRRSGRSPDDISSIVLVERNKSHVKSEAILRIANSLDFPLPLLAGIGSPFPLFFRDLIYDTIANSRYNVFGKSTVCRMKDSDKLDRFIE